MPTLPPEVDLFPECLFDNEKAFEFANRAWRVLHTLPRQEKALARQLQKKSLPFYLPSVPRRRLARGRAVTSHVPLFPSYVFLLAHEEDRLAALTTGRIVRLLKVVDQDGLWRDLRQVKRLIGSGARITPEGELRPGTVVEIRSGPLAGLKGTIVSTASGRRFVVQVDFIHRGASVLLDDFTLARID